MTFLKTLAFPLKIWNLFNLTPFNYQHINTKNNHHNSFRLFYSTILIGSNVILLFFYIFKLNLYVNLNEFLFFIIIKISILNMSRIHMIVSLIESWFKQNDQIKLFVLIEQSDFILMYKCGIKIDYNLIRKKQNRTFSLFIILFVGIFCLLMYGVINSFNHQNIHYWLNCLICHLWIVLHQNQFLTIVHQIHIRLKKINKHIDGINKNQVEINTLKHKVDDDIFLFVRSQPNWKEKFRNGFTAKQLQGLHDAVSSLYKAHGLISYMHTWTLVISFALNSLLILSTLYTLVLYIVKYKFSFANFMAMCIALIESLNRILAFITVCHYTTKEVRIFIFFFLNCQFCYYRTLLLQISLFYN